MDLASIFNEKFPPRHPCRIPEKKTQLDISPPRNKEISDVGGLRHQIDNVHHTFKIKIKGSPM
jgi:hypothetical protein